MAEPVETQKYIDLHIVAEPVETQTYIETCVGQRSTQHRPLRQMITVKTLFLSYFLTCFVRLYFLCFVKVDNTELKSVFKLFCKINLSSVQNKSSKNIIWVTNLKFETAGILLFEHNPSLISWMYKLTDTAPVPVSRQHFTSDKNS